MNAERPSLIAIALVLCTALGAVAAVEDDLHWAVRIGDAAVVAALLNAGANVNAVAEDGVTALHLAAMRGDAELVAKLLAAGADARAQDLRGRTPLHYAAMTDNTEVLDALLSAGADVRAADADGDTALHLAARRVRPEAMNWLLAHGANVDARNAAGQTPLHVLGASGREEDEVALLTAGLAEVLMQNGADATALDHAGVQAWPRAVTGETRQPSGYPTYDTIVAQLQNRASTYPSICRLVDLGLSVQSRRIYALKITDNPDVEEDEPEFKYIANMHGDEVTGLFMCLNLIDYLLQNYGSVQRATDLVNGVEIWIVPTMNPDGYMLNQRYNASGADLNRNFPEGSGSSPDPNSPAGHPTEVQVIMNWSFAHSFTLAANFHGGALVANYPFDNDGLGSVNSPTPDDDVFIAISEEYSEDNLPMWNSTEFYHGISNGAAWYAIDGGMQDWDYRYQGTNHVTMEIGTKTPAYSSLPTYWTQNQESMLSYLETVQMGVRGIVTNAYTGAPLAATVSVVGRNHNIYTDPDVGDYHRMLLPGTYQIRFQAAGYDTVTLPVTVYSGAATQLNAAMSGPPSVVSPNGGEVLTATVPTTVSWAGAPTAQFQVQYSSNYGQSGQTTDTFESGSLGSAYTTGGSAPWYVTTGSPHAGTYSARAGAITHGQTTWMTRTAEPGTMSFYYKVSSEAAYDWFNFYIDGVQKVHRAGSVGWTLYTTTLAAGSTHVLKWEYTKDAGVSGGLDTAWIDDLSLTGDSTSWTDIVALTGVGATSTPWTPTVVSATNKVRVRAYASGAWGSWDESNAVFTVQAAPPPGTPANPDPSNGAADISVETDLDWADASGATSYDVYFGEANPPPLAGNTATSQWVLPTLADGTTYHWQVVAISGGGSTPGPVWSFTTAAATYPVGDMNCDHTVGFLDINPFVMALADPTAYTNAYPGCPILNADVNGDGSVAFSDINPFVTLLAGS